MAQRLLIAGDVWSSGARARRSQKEEAQYSRVLGPPHHRGAWSGPETKQAESKNNFRSDSVDGFAREAWRVFDVNQTVQNGVMD
jgi:hypothetical protein